MTSHFNFKVTREDIESLNETIRKWELSQKEATRTTQILLGGNLIAELVSDCSLEDIADTMKIRETSPDDCSGLQYDISAPTWSWKLSRKQVEYLMQTTLKIYNNPNIPEVKPRKPKHSMPFWANNWRKK